MSRGLTKQGATVNLGTPLLIERLPEARKAKMRGERACLEVGNLLGVSEEGSLFMSK